MTKPQTDDRPPPTGLRWWLAWALLAVVVAGGVALTLRLAPGVTPILDTSR